MFSKLGSMFSAIFIAEYLEHKFPCGDLSLRCDKLVMLSVLRVAW